MLFKPTCRVRRADIGAGILISVSTIGFSILTYYLVSSLNAAKAILAAGLGTRNDYPTEIDYLQAEAQYANAQHTKAGDIAGIILACIVLIGAWVASGLLYKYARSLDQKSEGEFVQLDDLEERSPQPPPNPPIRSKK